MGIRGRRSQMQLSFGMIFSIILIIVFLFFAFYAIRTFLRVNDSANVGNFISSLQEDVDDMWRGDQGSQTISYGLPSKIAKVCFEDRGDKNLVFLDDKNENIPDVPLFYIEHIDLTKTLGNSIFDGKPMRCFTKKDGKVKILLEKKFGDDLVTIKNPTQ